MRGSSVTPHHFSLLTVFIAVIMLTHAHYVSRRAVGVSALSLTSVSSVPPYFPVLSVDQIFIYTKTLLEAKPL